MDCDPKDPKVITWHYEGRDVPIEIHNGLSREQLIDAIAEFLWTNRHVCGERPKNEPEVET